MDTEPSQTLAVLFSDVSGSVKLFDALGDTAAWEVIKGCIRIMSEEVESRGGTVIKTIGDEVMCTLPTADAAMEATVRMQERISADVTSASGIDTSGLTIRIGFNYGPVIPSDNDVFGDTVNVAARMAGAAKGGQILTTREAVEALSPNLRQQTRLFDRMPVKGKGTMEIHEVVWEEGNATVLSTRFASPKAREALLTLRYHDRTVTMNSKSDPVILGRGEQADLQVDDTKASRLHARIECMRDKFVIVDESANGTNVSTALGEVSLRRKEQHVLTGSGAISLGRKVEGNAEVVHYECK